MSPTWPSDLPLDKGLEFAKGEHLRQDIWDVAQGLRLPNDVARLAVQLAAEWHIPDSEQGAQLSLPAALTLTIGHGERTHSRWLAVLLVAQADYLVRSGIASPRATPPPIGGVAGPSESLLLVLPDASDDLGLGGSLNWTQLKTLNSARAFWYGPTESLDALGLGDAPEQPEQGRSVRLVRLDLVRSVPGLAMESTSEERWAALRDLVENHGADVRCVDLGVFPESLPALLDLNPRRW